MADGDSQSAGSSGPLHDMGWGQAAEALRPWTGSPCAQTGSLPG